LASVEVALVILLLICLAAIPGTFLSNRHAYYGSTLFIILLACLTISLVLCTLQRWRRLAISVLVIHVGIVVTIAGFVVRELTGTVATINVYENDPVRTFYLPYRDADVDLGFSLVVHKINTDYYPVPVKIGVLRGAEKHALFTLKTGEQFTVQGYRVIAEKFNPLTQVMSLTVYAGDRLVGRTDTENSGTLPADFPFQFRLVAFQDVQIRRSWLDMEVTGRTQSPVKGISEINRPLSWQGYNFYYVKSSHDEQGRIYAGIQIVRDPGQSIVFTGMVIAVIGAIMATVRRLR
jgi:cytochrome c biogenesis protein ResB